MPALRVELPRRVQATVRTAAGWAAAVDEAVEMLRSRQSRWPVDTGRSKRAWRRTGEGWSASVYNPLSYSSYVEAQNRSPVRRTLEANSARLIRAARAVELNPSLAQTAAERRTRGLQEVRRAAAARERIEAADGQYRRYLDLFRAAGRRGPRIPGRLRAIDRRIRIEASRGN